MAFFHEEMSVSGGALEIAGGNRQGENDRETIGSVPRYESLNPRDWSIADGRESHRASGLRASISAHARSGVIEECIQIAYHRRMINYKLEGWKQKKAKPPKDLTFSVVCGKC